MDQERQRYFENQCDFMALDRFYFGTECHQIDSIKDTSREQLQIVQKSRTHPDPSVLTDLKKRKLINMHKVISYEFERGPNFAPEFSKEETDLTADMLAS